MQVPQVSFKPVVAKSFCKTGYIRPFNGLMGGAASCSMPQACKLPGLLIPAVVSVPHL